MNRYLIAALYVMAGCVVAVPLKVQENPESLRGERCRLVVTNAVKIVSAYIESKDTEQISCVLASDCFNVPEVGLADTDYSFDKSVLIRIGTLCYSSHKIRAPENN